MPFKVEYYNLELNVFFNERLFYEYNYSILIKNTFHPEDLLNSLTAHKSHN